MAVDDLTFTVAEGETFGLIGTSGSGKTTTLKMINRLIEADNGTIRIDGSDIATRDPVELRKGIGYVIQKSGLFPHYTVAENIGVVPHLLGWPKSSIEQKTRELLTLVGLSPGDYLDRYPLQLSGGQQQRVSLARALAADPAIVLLDEPFGGIDPITRSRIRNEFKELTGKMHKTMVLVTHDVAEAVELCDRMALLDHGRLQQAGTPKELLFQPVNNFVKQFFDNSRFLLELHIISLSELIPLISAERNNRTNNLRIHQGASVKQAIDTLEQSTTPDPVLDIIDNNGEYIISCDESVMLSAFYMKREQLMRKDSP